MTLTPSSSGTLAADQAPVVASSDASRPLTVTRRTPVAPAPSSFAVPLTVTAGEDVTSLPCGEVTDRSGAVVSGGGGGCTRVTVTIRVTPLPALSVARMVSVSAPSASATLAIDQVPAVASTPEATPLTVTCATPDAGEPASETLPLTVTLDASVVEPSAGVLTESDGGMVSRGGSRRVTVNLATVWLPA